MLQAATGKLFTNRNDPRIRTLRGVIYTNLSLCTWEPFKTSIGTLQNFDSASNPNALSYELVEQMEAAQPAAGVLISRTVGAYIHDFADVASFGLRAICTPDVRVAERLLHQRPRPGDRHPSERLAHFYDATVNTTLDDLKAFEHFAEQLMGLRRSTYLAVIQAIRTYVAAVHRMSDDLNLAYTLLVMSVESLAQKFDGYKTVWEDVPNKNREAIDAALTGVSSEHAQAVREAVIASEHPRLGHRFVQFVLEYLPAGYFSELADREKRPTGRRDLEAAVRNLYGIRSSYVHTLEPLTKEFLHLASLGETYEDHEKIMFSFQGLFRLVRAVIMEFVSKAEKVDHEPYDYEWDNPHLLRLRQDPSAWIYNAEGLNNQSCRVYFRGLVELIDSCLSEFPNRKLHPFDAIIESGLKMRPQFNSASQLALLGFYFINQHYLGQGQGSPTLSEQDIELINKPSLESLITHAVIGNDTEWLPSEHCQQLERYYAQRFKPTGIKAPSQVEACMGLALAERYRRAGQAEEARAQILRTAEDFAHDPKLREFSQTFEADEPIQWLQIAYPKTASDKVPTLECIGL